MICNTMIMQTRCSFSKTLIPSLAVLIFGVMPIISSAFRKPLLSVQNQLSNESPIFSDSAKIIDTSDYAAGDKIQHVKVWYKDGGFAAWPANNGIWIWGKEILVGFVTSDHMKDSSSHTYNRKIARNMYARSLDAGLTWTIEDPYLHGQTKRAFDNMVEERDTKVEVLNKSIDFSNPDFAMTFLRVTNDKGPTFFYYSYDRGRNWNGPYRFADYKPGTANRTDYIVNGKHSLLSFLSVGHGRVGVAQTNDGAQSWQLLSWIGPDRTDTTLNGFLTMPASVRLSKKEILTVIRQREESKHNLLSSYLSKDNGATWKQLQNPVENTGRSGSPPALLKLKDGRLALAYAIRSESGSKICISFSKDSGLNWQKEIVLRGDDGANWDIGYPRMVEAPDGKLVIVYYWNNALADKDQPYRYIAATIYDPPGE